MGYVLGDCREEVPGLSSGKRSFEDGAALTLGLSSGRACFEEESALISGLSSGRACFEDGSALIPGLSSERCPLRTGKIPDRVGNDFVGLSLGDCWEWFWVCPSRGSLLRTSSVPMPRHPQKALF